jgi:hypothetical protein
VTSDAQPGSMTIAMAAAPPRTNSRRSQAISVTP